MQVSMLVRQPWREFGNTTTQSGHRHLGFACSGEEDLIPLEFSNGNPNEQQRYIHNMFTLRHRDSSDARGLHRHEVAAAIGIAEITRRYSMDITSKEEANNRATTISPIIRTDSLQRTM
jgi:hypothetical protein